MRIGVDYCPEYWDSSTWRHDAEMMTKCGVRLVRIGRSAWNWMEPQDGVFDLSQLDEVIAVFSENDIDVMLCVPTDRPPLWLIESHPEIMISDRKGNTGKVCMNSPVFREYAARLTGKLAERYGSENKVAVWQTDHDISAFQCGCDVCCDKFRKWLLKKYESMENVSAALGRSSVCGIYSDISQIHIPAFFDQSDRDPSLVLEYMRFCSESAIDFIREQSMIIRSTAPKSIITTDTSLGKDKPDIYRMYAMLDIASFNNYPSAELYEDGEAVDSNAFLLDMMRGIKGKDFWITEQISGSVTRNGYMLPAPKPGMIKGYDMQAIAHGADTIIHYTWRTPLSGAEMFRQGLMGHSNTPSLRFMEFMGLCKEISRLSVLDGTKHISEIAVIYSPDCERALKAQKQSVGFSYISQLKAFYDAFSHYGANVDIVPPTADISSYKIVVAPALYIYEKKACDNIYRFVSGGGTLIMTCRSGVKDNNNNCMMDVIPTVYKELIGAETTDQDPIGSGERTIKDFAGNVFDCTQWCDILKLTSARAYAEYNDNFYKGYPAVTMNKYCGGVAYYVGTVCSQEFYESLAGNVMMQTGIPKLKSLPVGVEVTTRTNGNDEYIFFFNNSGSNAVIALPKLMYSIIDGKNKERLELKPFDMDIVRK